ncbi:MAG: helix-hairpin-helix domain-containing protein [Elusimicrobiota bacterium]|nr:helix-hairpin-helix domain-containing protein [Elusimicrobiota bacterium]
MRIGDTQISPRQGAAILLGIAFSFLAVIIHLKNSRIPASEKVKIKAVLVPPKIEIAKSFSLDELLKKTVSSPSGGGGEEVISIGSVSSGPAEVKKAAPAGKINLNTASEGELMELPDMTRRAAKSIIEYRGKMGEIWELSEIKGLPGIDEALINRIRRKAVLE